MKEWIVELMEQYGYVGIFSMMTIENLFPPIPSEVILPFGGFMTTYTNLSVLGVIMTATTGSVIGAMILYGIGMQIDVRRLSKMVTRWGHLVRIKPSDIQTADQWFKKYGYWTVFICRMIPLIRSLISIPAGMSKMNFFIFFIFTLIGTVIWNTILVIVGVILGESWNEILHFMAVYSTVTYVIIVIGFILFIFLYIQKKRIKK